MAYELALEIRANCVAPGAVEGDRIDSVIAGQARVRGISGQVPAVNAGEPNR
jgi:NAD(P)-dependent dehydrogenase (short-subunit alcohol dehydrogenase family)